ncbi:hypothetical protein, partial [Bacteroides caecimuris]|uniref:hypothetical protein n=1 Tax=Bacteroides caecimuris TaxID=1796613 RepID=UPI0026471D81
MWQAVARFSDRIRSSGGRFCPKRLAARPCRCHQAIRYLCIRASGTSGWRDEPQLYHRLLSLPQETNNV